MIFASKSYYPDENCFPCLLCHLEVTDDYTYLGIVFSYNGNFNKAIDKQITAATRALFILQKKAKILKLPIDLQIELFDKTVLPILLYGSEVWGFSKNVLRIEIFYRKFLKGLLHLNSRTPNPMVYGETGKTDISINIKERMVNFWTRLHHGKQSKMSVILFKVVKGMHDDPLSGYKSEWINFVKNVFDSTGFNNLWYEAPIVLTQNNFPSNYPVWLKKSLNLRLNDIFKQVWHSQLQSNRNCTNYRLFKDDHCFENYLTSLSDVDRIALSKFRCRSIKLPVVNSGSSVGDVSCLCKLCDLKETGDEFLYILKCLFFCKGQKETFENKQQEKQLLAF